jgi:acetyl-CoA acyltransferase
VTIDRRCGSGQQAFESGVHAILAGAVDAVVVAGVESMSRVPMGSNRQGRDPHGPAALRYPPGLVPQGISAELVAARWGLSRVEMDAFAVRSHHLAAAAADSGAFAAEITPIITPEGTSVRADETIRRDTSTPSLAALRPAFQSAAMSARFPQITWSVTAGNSSQLADGASALLVTSEQFAERHGLVPAARYLGGALAADDPIIMLTAPVAATGKLLDRLHLTLDDIGHYEVNEAFAAVPLAWAAELKADPARLNPRGGAIALGHPLGASGARLLTTAVHALPAGTLGLVTMCEAGGMANATVFERL